MPGFLTAEWVDELNRAAAGIAVDGDVSLVIGHVVTGGPAGDVRYVFRVGDGRVRAELGGGAADVTFHEDWDTAAAMSRGELLAQQAVSEGRLSVSGDVARLARHAAVLAGLGAAFDDLRARTTY